VRNPELAADYVGRAAVRLRALDVLFEAASWGDVVRESQEALELALKGLRLACRIEPPRIHDVADVLVSERERLPPPLHGEVERLAALSRELGRDGELAFYGAKDLTPSRFCREPDATRARGRPARRRAGQALRARVNGRRWGSGSRVR
jgi:HEPN domain-containing protein